MAFKEYKGKDIVVTYDAERCIHAGDCVKNLPEVFDPLQRPWVRPDNASEDEVSQVILKCSAGALKFESHDPKKIEPRPEKNTVKVIPRGPYYFRGDMELKEILQAEEGKKEFRLALCRCGASQKRPYCDGAHKKYFFEEDPPPEKISVIKKEEDEGKKKTLTISVAPKGPLLLNGPFEIQNGDQKPICSGQRTALCRCGYSKNTPFCDGSHAQSDFES